jgi:hypothetical protein
MRSRRDRIPRSAGRVCGRWRLFDAEAGLATSRPQTASQLRQAIDGWAGRGLSLQDVRNHETLFGRRFGPLSTGGPLARRNRPLWATTSCCVRLRCVGGWGLCINFSIVGLATVGSGPVKVFNEHDLVLAFVVDQFVSNSADQHKSEPSRAESFLLAHNVMGDNTWLAMNGRV